MWQPIVHIIIGLGLMAMPSLLGMDGVAADSNHICGPIIATLGIIALWDVNKAAIKANIIVAIWLILAPLFIEHSTVTAAINVVAGIVVAISSAKKRKDQHSYGGGWKSLIEKHPPHMQALDKDSH